MADPLLESARQAFGAALLGPDDLAAFLGDGAGETVPAPDAALLDAARGEDCLLVFRPARLPDGRPLTLVTLFERIAGLARPDLTFRGDEPWFLREPSARTETPEEGWALVSRAPWPETLNRTYDEATLAIERRAGGRPWRRRRAIEAAFDTLAYAHARGEHLLAECFDWTATPSADGGLVNVGGFRGGILQVVAYSPPVKHGWLGSCPTLVGR